MDQKTYELGKQAAKLVARSETIQVGKPGAKGKINKALAGGKHTNSDGPWQKGRKVKR